MTFCTFGGQCNTTAPAPEGEFTALIDGSTSDVNICHARSLLDLFAGPDFEALQFTELDSGDIVVGGFDDNYLARGNKLFKITRANNLARRLFVASHPENSSLSDNLYMITPAQELPKRTDRGSGVLWLPSSSYTAFVADINFYGCFLESVSLNNMTQRQNAIVEDFFEAGYHTVYFGNY